MSADMTAAEQIQHWLNLANAATEGPWVAQDFDDTPGDWGVGILGKAATVTGSHLTAYTMTLGDEGQTVADAAHIAASRVAVPAMADALQAVLALHRPCDNDDRRTPICPDCQGKAGVHPCGCWADADRQPVCSSCNTGFKTGRVEWPCPTVEAIEAALGKVAGMLELP